MTVSKSPEPETRRVLTLLDCVCIIVGTIIGAGIFELPGTVASKLTTVPWFLGVWVAGGFVALMGALCFAELTTTCPDPGGDYAYLKRAYQQRLAFVFSWTAFWVIRPGNIGVMAMIFGKFAVEFWTQIFGGQNIPPLWIAIGIVMLMTILNGLGVIFSKTAQNLLTIAKVLGILLVLGSAVLLAISSHAASSSNAPPTSASTYETTANQSANSSAATATLANPATSAQAVASASGRDSSSKFQWSSFWLAMVLVMFAFGGWNDIAFVASEVANPQINLLRSLVFGTLLVLVIYLLVNVALIYGLGIERLAQLDALDKNPTAEFVKQTTGLWGAAMFSCLVCISCLGAINGMIFTSPRIYWATAQDYPALSGLTGSSVDRKGWRAISLQGAVTIGFLWAFSCRGGGVENLVTATAPYFWFFLGLTVLSLIINRWRRQGQFEGFRVPLYPLPPILFIAACGFMVYQAVSYLLVQKLGYHALVIGLWVGLGWVGSDLLIGKRSVSHAPSNEN